MNNVNYFSRIPDVVPRTDEGWVEDPELREIRLDARNVCEAAVRIMQLAKNGNVVGTEMVLALEALKGRVRMLEMSIAPEHAYNR